MSSSVQADVSESESSDPSNAGGPPPNAQQPQDFGPPRVAYSRSEAHELGLVWGGVVNHVKQQPAQQPVGLGPLQRGGVVNAQQPRGGLADQNIYACRRANVPNPDSDSDDSDSTPPPGGVHPPTVLFRVIPRHNPSNPPNSLNHELAASPWVERAFNCSTRELFMEFSGIRARNEYLEGEVKRLSALAERINKMNEHLEGELKRAGGKSNKKRKREFDMQGFLDRAKRFCGA
jgi:hypothetical protein